MVTWCGLTPWHSGGRVLRQEVCGWINDIATKPVWAKMTPNITDITLPARTGEHTRSFLDHGSSVRCTAAGHGISRCRTCLALSGSRHAAPVTAQCSNPCLLAARGRCAGPQPHGCMGHCSSHLLCMWCSSGGQGAVASVSPSPRRQAWQVQSPAHLTRPRQHCPPSGWGRVHLHALPVVQPWGQGARAWRPSTTIQSVMGINLETLRPEPSVEGYTTPGGYSSKAVKPIALAKVHIMSLHRQEGGCWISKAVGSLLSQAGSHRARQDEPLLAAAPPSMGA